MGEAIEKTSDPYGRAADVTVEKLREAIAARKTARLAIPGGSVAKVVGLVRERLTAEEWKQVRLTWIDERCVDFDHPDSNRGQAYRAGWLSEDAPPHTELPLWLDGETPERAANRVRAGLERQFANKFDVVLYGLGEDGHLASIFPGQAAMFAKGRVTHVPDSPKPPPERMTLTFDALRMGLEALLVVSGESKREALQRVVAGDPELPSSVLPELTIITDLELEGS